MARNEEKQYGRLNRLILQKEKEEYEKHQPQRPRLDSLITVEEIQKWLPSIKRDLDFYLKKSMVTCYSEKHIQECHLKVNNLEKEYKAFVRKITQLSSGTLEAIPWTNRAYKRKNGDSIEPRPIKDFVPIASPILEQEKTSSLRTSLSTENMPLMNMPLSFNLSSKQNRNLELANKHFKEDSRIIYLDSSYSKIEQPTLPESSFGLEPYKLACQPVAKMSLQDKSLSFNFDKKQNCDLKSLQEGSQEDWEVTCSSNFEAKNCHQNTGCVAFKANIVSYDYSSDSDCS